MYIVYFMFTYYLWLRSFVIFLISWKYNGNGMPLYFTETTEDRNLLLLFCIKQIFDHSQGTLEFFDKGLLIFIARMIRICIHCDGNRISPKHVM